MLAIWRHLMRRSGVLLLASLPLYAQCGETAGAPEGNAWRQAIYDPTAVFTALIALFTLAVFLEAAASNKRRLRAYVFPDSVFLVDGATLNPPRQDRINVPGAALVFKNSGQTPAYQCVTWAQVAVIEPINEHTLVLPAMELKHAATLGMLGLMHKAIWFSRVLSAAEIDDIQKGVRAVYVYGRIQYRDVFGRKFHTDFRGHVTGVYPPTPQMTLTYAESGNTAT